MAKHALSLLIKIALFTLVMLFVAKVIPYEDLVNSIIDRFDYQSASNFTRFIMGEPDPEVWESLGDYFGILINILISVPVMSAIITVYNGLTRNVDRTSLPKEFVFSTLRRLAKLFAFTFLFWGLFRFLPYQFVFPDNQTFSAFTMATIVAFNLVLTIICYGFITKKITTKRSL